MDSANVCAVHAYMRRGVHTRGTGSGRDLEMSPEQMPRDYPGKHCPASTYPILCIPFLLWGESASQTDTAPLAVADSPFGGTEKGRHLTTFTPNGNNTK